MIEFTWETLGGLVVGVELLENPDYGYEGDNLKWAFALHLGIVRLVFSKYVLEG